MISMKRAEKKEFRINFNLFLSSFRSSPASNTIIIRPTMPKTSTSFVGNSIANPDLSAIYRSPIPAKSKSKTDGTLIYLLMSEKIYETTTRLQIMIR